jgi:hypothetical protein
VQRSVQITFRELSCVLVDNHVLSLPVPPRSIQSELTPQQPADAQVDVPNAFGPVASVVGMYAIDPELARTGEDPVTAIDRFVKMLTTGVPTEYNPNATPLVGLGFADASIKDLLFFNPVIARTKLFDPSAFLPPTSQLCVNGSLWDQMTAWSDSDYQELFCVSRDLVRHPKPVEFAGEGALLIQEESPLSFHAPLFGGAESATRAGYPVAVEIVFRKKPFAGRIGPGGDFTGLRPARESQFDPEFEADASWNVTLNPEDVLSFTWARSSRDVKNLFWVQPCSFNNAIDDAFRKIHGPLVDGSPSSPSYVRRWGMRMVSITDRYLSHYDATSSDAASPDTQSAIARQRELLLWGWMRFAHLLSVAR